MGSWFESKRDGKCTSCGAETHQGDRMYARQKGFYLCEECGSIAEQLPQTGGLMEASVLANLDEFPQDVRAGSLAQSMLFMARQLDAGDVAPRDVASYTKEIRQNYMQLRLLYPPSGDEDETDMMQKRREARFRYDEGYDG